MTASPFSLSHSKKSFFPEVRCERSRPPDAIALEANFTRERDKKEEPFSPSSPGTRGYYSFQSLDKGYGEQVIIFLLLAVRGVVSVCASRIAEEGAPISPQADLWKGWKNKRASALTSFPSLSPYTGCVQFTAISGHPGLSQETIRRSSRVTNVRTEKGHLIAPLSPLPYSPKRQPSFPAICEEKIVSQRK